MISFCLRYIVAFYVTILLITFACSEFFATISTNEFLYFIKLMKSESAFIITKSLNPSASCEILFTMSAFFMFNFFWHIVALSFTSFATILHSFGEDIKELPAIRTLFNHARAPIPLICVYPWLDASAGHNPV